MVRLHCITAIRDNKLRETPSTLSPQGDSRALKPAFALVGPTASGKSALSLHLARLFDGEVINCDSLQLYRHFDIGTGKVPEAERAGVQHHLLDVLTPDQIFTAGDYSRAARALLSDLGTRNKLPIVTGGTGFYLRALIDGLAPGPQRDDALRAKLMAREAARPGSLHRILQRFDRVTAARIHANDVPKVVRALEICLAARRPAADVFAAGRDALEGWRFLKIGLFPDREELYGRIGARVEQMFEQGLIAEVEGILALGYPPSTKPFEAIGYKQALQSVQLELRPKDAIFYTKQATRQYAKRQLTWFRQEPGIQVLRGFGDQPAIQAQAAELARNFLQL